MKKRALQFIGAIALLVVIVGCSADKYAPVPINEETDRCAICNMAIKDDQYATQIITKEGQSIKFDDLGDLNEWRNQYGTDTIGATYVRDYDSMQWIKYEKAYYVYDASIPTPMAYGVISFETEKAAEEYVAEHSVGTVLNADQLASHSWAVNHEMMGEHGHDHGHDHDGHAEDADGAHEHEEDAHHEEEQSH